LRVVLRGGGPERAVGGASIQLRCDYAFKARLDHPGKCRCLRAVLVNTVVSVYARERRLQRSRRPTPPRRPGVPLRDCLVRGLRRAVAVSMGQTSTTKSRRTASVGDATRLPSPAPGPQRRLSPATQEPRKRSRQQVRSQLLRTAEARSIDTEPHWSPTRPVVRAQLFSSQARERKESDTHASAIGRSRSRST
jgi:hypothetical protein